MPAVCQRHAAGCARTPPHPTPAGGRRGRRGRPAGCGENPGHAPHRGPGREFLFPQLDLGGLAERTAIRLELGIPADLVELGEPLGGELSRAQYLVLLHAGLGDPASIDQGTLEDLLACLGDKDRVALVLERVGQRPEVGIVIAPLLPPPAE